MKVSKAITIAGAAAGVSYLTYQAIAEKVFHSVFDKKNYKYGTDPKYQKWINESNVTQVKIDSFDGLKLNAYNVRNHDDAPYIIMLHGIWSNKTYMYNRAYEFDKLGYNILLVDQRAAGDSEGNYYTYGQKESLDLLLWIDYLIQKDSNVKIILYGVSMGAATIMIASASKLPDNVRCLVEDCGFSSMYDVVERTIRKEYGIKYTKVIMKLLESKMAEKFNMTFDDACPKKCLQSNEKPILIIHGMKDEFVPYDMAKILYNNNKGIRKFYPVPDADHGEAIHDKNYFLNIDLFIKKYL